MICEKCSGVMVRLWNPVVETSGRILRCLRCRDEVIVIHKTSAIGPSETIAILPGSGGNREED